MMKVVIIEDMEYIRKGLVMTTPWADFDCMVAGEAQNGRQGLEVIRRVQPDIVITDIRMEEMDGLSLIEKAKEICDCEFIIISGYDEFEYAKKAVSFSVKGYLLKPVDDDELRQIMVETVHSIQAKRKYQQVMSQYSSGLSTRLAVGDDLMRRSFKNKYLDNAIQFLQLHCEEDISIKTVAEELQISQSYLLKLFKEHTNYTFVDALTLFRIRKSLQLLEDDSLRIYEIAQLVGYKDARYFSDVFRKLLGCTPTEYREGKQPTLTTGGEPA